MAEIANSFGIFRYGVTGADLISLSERKPGNRFYTDNVSNAVFFFSQLQLHDFIPSTWKKFVTDNHLLYNTYTESEPSYDYIRLTVTRTDPIHVLTQVWSQPSKKQLSPHEKMAKAILVVAQRFNNG